MGVPPVPVAVPLKSNGVKKMGSTSSNGSTAAIAAAATAATSAASVPRRIRSTGQVFMSTGGLVTAAPEPDVQYGTQVNPHSPKRSRSSLEVPRQTTAVPSQQQNNQTRIGNVRRSSTASMSSAHDGKTHVAPHMVLLRELPAARITELDDNQELLDTTTKSPVGWSGEEGNMGKDSPGGGIRTVGLTRSAAAAAAAAAAAVVLSDTYCVSDADGEESPDELATSRDSRGSKGRVEPLKKGEDGIMGGSCGNRRVRSGGNSSSDPQMMFRSATMAAPGTKVLPPTSPSTGIGREQRGPRRQMSLPGPSPGRRSVVVSPPVFAPSSYASRSPTLLPTGHVSGSRGPMVVPTTSYTLPGPVRVPSAADMVAMQHPLAHADFGAMEEQAALEREYWEAAEMDRGEFRSKSGHEPATIGESLDRLACKLLGKEVLDVPWGWWIATKTIRGFMLAVRWALLKGFVGREESHKEARTTGVASGRHAF
ncbi:hypothetical protein HDU93_009089 [Gonapodya sp. JEL0774]|nr:hypothetical protein HDU93_009089 [Gonapodya sp. JEL0774]